MQNKQRPCILWFTGLSGAGKSTTAETLEKYLKENGYRACFLDGDVIRRGLSRDLGFTEADRRENIRRVGEVARLFVDAGMIVLAAFISPFREDRDMLRKMMNPGEFIEVFVDTPLAVCEQRDPKGLYKRARNGEIKHFTGVSDPYEAPENPEIRINTESETPEQITTRLATELRNRGILS